MLIKLVLLFFYFSAVTLYTQNENELKTSLLWEVSSENNSGSSYLFGTHHLFNNTFVDTSKIIDSILFSCNSVALEVNDLNIDSSFLKHKMKLGQDEYYMFNHADDEKILNDFLVKTMGSDKILTIYMLYKPMAIWLMLQAMKYTKDTKKSDSNNIMLDMYFKDAGIKYNKEIAGLETMEEQLSFFFDSISIKKQTQILVNYAKSDMIDHELGKEALDSCYRNLDLECLSNFSVFGAANVDENKLFLEGRNKRWMPKILSLIKKSVFIAVGALHLPGEAGLINLLRKEGFSVKPVKF